MATNRINQRQFKIIIERDEDGFYVASVPSLPGCHAQGKTMDSLMERTREAIELCIEVYRTNSKYRDRVQMFAYNPTFVGMEMVSL